MLRLSFLMLAKISDRVIGISSSGNVDSARGLPSKSVKKKSHLFLDAVSGLHPTQEL